MNTKTLILDAKARFSHNAAKAYLKEKYTNKLIIADQNGLWSADRQTISFLKSFTSKTLVLMDLFDNPVKVDRAKLLTKLQETYETAMNEWHAEWQELESKR